MKKIKTITFSLPFEMGKEIEEIADAEHRTISELIREAIRQYQSRRNLRILSDMGTELVKAKGLKPEDFGGPFDE